MSGGTTRMAVHYSFQADRKKCWPQRRSAQDGLHDDGTRLTGFTCVTGPTTHSVAKKNDVEDRILYQNTRNLGMDVRGQTVVFWGKKDPQSVAAFLGSVVPLSTFHVFPPPPQLVAPPLAESNELVYSSVELDSVSGSSAHSVAGAESLSLSTSGSNTGSASSLRKPSSSSV